MKILLALSVILLTTIHLHAADDNDWSGVKGTLTRTSDGLEMPFEIEKRMGSGSARMRATNPQTGEVFTGKYTGVIDSPQRSNSMVFSQNGKYLGNVQSTKAANTANAQGVLRGNKGTCISLQINIVTRGLFLSPKGLGTATDNKNQNYQLEF